MILENSFQKPEPNRPIIFIIILFLKTIQDKLNEKFVVLDTIFFLFLVFSVIYKDYKVGRDLFPI